MSTTSKGIVSGGPLAIRRALTCAECHKVFKNRGELLWHAEGCLMEAFENEVYTVNTEQFRRRLTLPVKPLTPAGITVKSVDDTPRQEHIQLKLREDVLMNQPGPSSQGVLYENGESLSIPQTIQGPGGLQMIVSVEKNRTRVGETPPLLELQLGEQNLQEFAQEEMLEDDDEEENLQSGSSYATNAQVIGAVANAGDDMKPKMECPTCGIILYRHNFAAHYRIHTGELPFACNYCPKRFRTTSSLKVHIRAHTGEKPYRCPQCEYATITKRNLDRHITIHHVQVPKNKGPVSRRSRYRDNILGAQHHIVTEVDWEEDIEEYSEKDHEYQEQNPSDMLVQESEEVFEDDQNYVVEEEEI